MTKTHIKTRVWTVTCPQCGVELYSRARHDYRVCGCSNQTMVDGGRDYLRYGGNNFDKIKTRIRYINATRQELYTDWNYRLNKLGIIKRGKK